jgi:O-Antigen ligase
MGPPGGRAAVSAFAIAAIGAAVIAGLMPGALSLSGTLAVAGVGLVALAVVVLRRSLTLASAPSLDPTAETTRASIEGADRLGESRDLRLSRMFFYLGTATVAEATWRPALGLTVSEILFMVALGGCIFAALRGHGLVPLPASLVVGVSLFVFGGAISSISARSPAGSGIAALHGAYVMLLWAWTGVMLLRTRQHILTAISLWVVSVAVLGAGALWQASGGSALTGPLEGQRATSFTDHPNDLGGAAAIGLVPALLLATRPISGQTVLSRVLPWLLVGLIALGLILSASVAGMAAGLVGLVVWLSAPSVRAPRRVAVVAVLASTLVVVAVAGGRTTSPTERLNLVTSAPQTQPGAGSGQERLSIVKTAWPRILADPVIGTGLDNNGKSVTIRSNGQSVAYQAHGAPLAAWYEAGIFGLVGALVILGALAVTGWRAMALASGADDILIAWSLFAAFAAFILYSMTVPFVFQQFGWFAGVMLLTWALRRDATGGAAPISAALPPTGHSASPQLAAP